MGACQRLGMYDQQLDREIRDSSRHASVSLILTRIEGHPAAEGGRGRHHVFFQVGKIIASSARTSHMEPGTQRPAGTTAVLSPDYSPPECGWQGGAGGEGIH